MKDRTDRTVSARRVSGFFPVLFCRVSLFLFFCFLSLWSQAEEITAVSGKYSQSIQRISLRYGINPRFVQALIWRESRFAADATGTHGEIGLMQVRMDVVQDWAKQHRRTVPSRDQIYEVEQNLSIGIWHLDRALKNWEGYPDQAKLALLEYNRGRSALLRALAHHDGDVAAMLNMYRDHTYPDDILAKFLEYSRTGEEISEFASLP